MSRHSGVRRTERQTLNASVKYTVSSVPFAWTASRAIGRALQQLRRDLGTMDKRTNPAKNLQAAIKRLEKLQLAISR
jgi:hypothetical protein